MLLTPRDTTTATSDVADVAGDLTGTPGERSSPSERSEREHDGKHDARHFHGETIGCFSKTGGISGSDYGC